MHLYDTARRQVVPFEPGPIVTLYTCGITPYDAAHLGHAATYLAFDVLQRRLRDLGHDTRLVRNVTDVDDDILRKARELGVHYLDLAVEELARFDSSMAALGLLPAASEPRATSAIAEILSLVDSVVESGHAYRSGGAVYFDVSSFGAFGQLSHLGRAEMLALARERGGNPDDPNKDDPFDFVLWQPSAPDEPSWESRFGPGRPGWHVECSALALRELGRTVDIHGGGSDLVFPHHECEAAQSEAVTGQPLARLWMHAGMVGLDGEKMSKSLGNLVFVEDLLKRADAAAARLALSSHHYREDWDWTDQQIEVATERLESWRAAASDAGFASGTVGDAPAGVGAAVAAAAAAGDAGVDSPVLRAVRDRLDDDLDLPGAIDVIDEAAARRRHKAGAEVVAAAALLGVPLSE
jgi:L-cysteine:1D-myo-inositol 2-amino-2-deoxy-alpha-D-glucopyranoside ligase